MQAVSQYLSHYAEPEIKQTQRVIDYCLHQQLVFQHVVVIPAFEEQADFIQPWFCSNLAASETLIIVVINQPSTYQGEQQQQLYQQLSAKGKMLYQFGSQQLLHLAESCNHLLLIDKFTQGLSPKQGVGLARKIGCDIALALINQGVVNKHYIGSTDADALLPEDYFNAWPDTTDRVSNAVALIYQFHHESDDPLIHQATAYYEQAMRYYVAGLSYAQSPYAYFTIGSVLAINADAYAKVRGFPKKSAGEDFYLLNKLAKLGEIQPAYPCIKLSARLSHRVPFGTGPAVSKIVEQIKQNHRYHYYHPEIFNELKKLLHHFKSLSPSTSLNHFYQQLPNSSVPALQSLGFEQFFHKQQKQTMTQFQKQLVVWFDAFRTLKYIHFLRDNAYPNIPLDDAISIAPFSAEI
jgi:hypothetical protein